MFELEFDIVALVQAIKDGIDMLADSTMGTAINIMLGGFAAIAALMILYSQSSKSGKAD